MSETDDSVRFMRVSRPNAGKVATDEPARTLADPRRRAAFLELAEDNDKLHKVVTEIAESSGVTFTEALGGTLAVIEAARERDALDESTCDPERLALSDRVQARALRERISFREALDREGIE